LALKDREETRHNKVELTEALDKYAHYVFSKEQKEREIGYALFTALGFPEVALKIGQYTADTAVTKLAEIQTNNPDEIIRIQAAKTLATLSSKQREVIIDVLRKFEGTNYNTVAAGPFDLSFGLGLFSIQTGELDKVLSTYISSPSAMYARDLDKYMDHVKSKNDNIDGTFANSLINDQGFKDLLIKIGNDPVMQKIEDNYINETIDKAILSANDIGITFPLSIAVIYDSTRDMGSGSVKRISERVSLALGGNPKSGVDEKNWINKFLEERLSSYKERFPEYKGLQNRVNFFIDLASKNDWLLENVA
jgi:hypothetical protein